ncbi:hypothetical protein ABZ767_27260 [Streptomyces pseudogriseolus]|uniref:Nucleopolyhedrovirus P10 family protein n=2 Tax=Streptomyces pseudogriseolus TaxID=36817 RepID=M3E4E0_STREZ|nr:MULTISPECIES: hypothetical protein [Streptomyces]EMF28146.1 hypothetical protein H114_15272 [Streptomyces gancidicus BKS 13-15]
MTADRWTRMVRQQVGLGRFLPLGGRHDGAWIAERAAGAVLRRAAERDVPEVRMDGIRIGLADPGAAAEPAVPAPPSALPPGPLRLTAEFAATAAWPLPETVSRLRAALAVTATERIGLEVTEVDLRVTDLLDTEPAAERTGAGGTTELAGGTTEPAGGTAEPAGAAATAGASVTPGAAQEAGDAAAGAAGVSDTSEDGGGSEADRVAGVVLEVPGVSRLTGVWGRPVRLGERAPATGDALPRRHARVDLAVAAGFRPLEVARAVRAAVAAAGPDRPTVAVLVTDLD